MEIVRYNTFFRDMPGIQEQVIPFIELDKDTEEHQIKVRKELAEKWFGTDFNTMIEIPND